MNPIWYTYQNGIFYYTTHTLSTNDDGPNCDGRTANTTHTTVPPTSNQVYSATPGQSLLCHGKGLVEILAPPVAHFLDLLSQVAEPPSEDGIEEIQGVEVERQ